MPIELIQLNQLRVSPRNVRQNTTTEVDTLAASIQALGLLQNLTVTPNCEGFEVVAGGRRLRALQLLASNGHLQPDHQVPCLVVDDTTAIEASTAENVVRLPMHPADQYDAFQTMADSGRSPGEIATRFGISEHHVRQMLRLAGVSPRILELYRADEIELAQVMALAIVDDHELQERTWKSVSRDPRWSGKPENIRKLLTPKEVPHDSELGRFVSLTAYRDAGGKVREDMFSDLRLMVDRHLVERLAKAKLQAKADKLIKDGWSWAEARLEWGWEECRKAGYIEQVDSWRTPTKAELEPLKAWCGCVVTIDPSGKPKVHYGFARKGAKPPKGDAAAEPGAEKPARDPGALSFAQTQALQGDLTAILRNQLALDPRVALAALAARLAARQLSRYGETVDSALRIDLDRYGLPAKAMEAVSASSYSATAADRWKVWEEKLRAVDGSIFDWLLNQPEQVTHELLAELASQSINVAQVQPSTKAIGPGFAQLAGVDVAAHWQVSQQWLAAQPKGYIVEAVRECCGKAAADGVAKLKKTEAAAKAAQLMAGKSGWLPKPLRVAKAKAKRASAARAGA